MRVCTTFPPRARDLRLDLFRGLANWAIFLDQIPHEVLSSITTRNYGFSDAADLFVFISGYTAALVFGNCWTWQNRQNRMLLPRARICPIYRDMNSVEEQPMRVESRWATGRNPGPAFLVRIFRGGMA